MRKVIREIPLRRLLRRIPARRIIRKIRRKGRRMWRRIGKSLYLKRYRSLRRKYHLLHRRYDSLRRRFRRVQKACKENTEFIMQSLGGRKDKA